MSAPLAAAGPSAYWYLARGTGVVAMLLLTGAVVLGVLESERLHSGRWPRFVVDRLHRDVSLLVLALLAAHIATSVLDSFAPIKLTDAVIPLASAYRPIWMGLGALAFDLLVAVAITSLVRRRLGYRAWRAVHWLAYASWPVAIVHGLGTGSDVRQGWLLALTAACVAAVLAAVVVRIVRVPAAPSPWREAGLGLAAALPLGLAAFMVVGPMAGNWAQRAGTPVALLREAHPLSYGSASTPVAARPSVDFRVPFTARLAGTATQSSQPGGAIVDLVLACTGDIRGELRVRLAGQPADTGGLSMTGSQVQLTAVGLSSVFEGTISSLSGQQFVAQVKDAAGTRLTLRGNLNIDDDNQTVSGTLTGARA